MEDESERTRLEKRRKRYEKRQLEREKLKPLEVKSFKDDLFIKIGIISILALIIVDFYVTMTPFFSIGTMGFEIAAITFFLMQALGICFGLGLFFAGKRMERETGKYGGVFQIDGSIIAAINLSVFLIANPLQYTQEDLIVNSLYFGLETVSSIAILIFTLLVAFFFILIGSNSQVHPLRYIMMVVGILWLVELFLPALSPSPYSDPVTYSIISAFTWIVYALTAYCLWKILDQSENLKPVTISTPYRIK